MNKDYILVIIPVLIWSSMGILVRYLSVSGLVAYFFAALISSIIFATLLIKEKKLKDFFIKKYLWIPITIGLFGVINNVSYFYAYQLTSIANATFVHYLAPVLVMIFSPLILAEKTKKRMWYSVILSLIGLFILLDMKNFNLSTGIFLAFLSAIGYSFGIIFFKKALKYYSSKEIIFSQMFFSTIILLPFIFYLKPVIAYSDIFPLITLGVIYQGFAVLLFITALKNLPSQNVSIVTYLEPIGAVLLALLILKEIPSLTTIIGGAIILISSYLIIKTDS